MAWSQRFIDRISKAFKSPIFIVQSVDIGEFPADFAVATHDGFGIPARIEDRSIRLIGPRVSIQTWNSSMGSFSFDLLRAKHALKLLGRGMPLVLKMGFHDFDIAEFEPIAMGVVDQITRRGNEPRWTVQCADALGLLQSRRVTKGVRVQQFSGNDDKGRVGAERAIQLDYTAASSPKTIDISGDTNIPVVPKSIHKNLALISPDPIKTDSSFTPFVVRYESIGGAPGSQTRLEGVEDAGALNTFLADAQVDDKVTIMGYLSGDPYTIYERVLTSTGTGANGDEDVYEDSWGFGVPIEAVDTTDIGVWRSAFLEDIDKYIIELSTTAPVISGLSFLNNALRPLGMWPTLRQGQMTMRHVQNPLNHAFDIHTNLTITDSDIASLDTYQAYDPTVQAEYARVRAVNSKKSTEEDSGDDIVIDESSLTDAEELGSVPGLEEFEVNLRNILFLRTITSDVRNHTTNRLKRWYQRIPELYTITCAGWRLAGLAPGDLVDVTSNLMTGRSEGGTSGLDRRTAMVLSTQPDWSGATVRLALSLLPEHETLLP